MSKDINPSLQKSEIEQDPSLMAPTVQLSRDALARRRMLLKSLGKGVSIASVAAVPMQTLAAITTLPNTNFRCTVSGQHSAIHSGQTSAGTCAGYSHGWYKMKEHWPNYSSTFNNKAHNIVSGSSIPFDMDTPFSTLFESGPDSGLFDCINLNNNTAAHWVCALLNATPGPTLPARTGLNFPYTGAEVIALYKGKQKDAALIFFQAYLDNK